MPDDTTTNATADRSTAAAPDAGAAPANVRGASRRTQRQHQAQTQAMRRIADTFVPPVSLDDAEARRIFITSEIGSIQTQLGDRDHKDGMGNRMSENDYWAWRKKASWAYQMKLAELRQVNAWIKSANRTAAAAVDPSKGIVIDPNDPDKMLVAAYRVLKRLGSEIDLQDDEQAVVDALWECIRGTVGVKGTEVAQDAGQNAGQNARQNAEQNAEQDATQDAGQEVVP